MGRGGAAYLNYAGLLLLSAVSYTHADLWSVDIDNGPAPSPADGPPFSAHATRNRALLPYQIIGIVGAYLGFVLVLGTLLFTTGRKMRRHALLMAEKPELVKPIMRVFDGTSPAGERKGFSILRKQKSAASSIRSSNFGSPIDSIVHFDPDVIQQNKQRDQDELANYYAHVFEAQEKMTQKPEESAIELQEVPRISVPQHPRKKLPLRMDTSGAQYASNHPASPRTPKSPSVRAIYPPIAYGSPAQTLQDASQYPTAVAQDARFTSPAGHHTGIPSSPASQSMRGRLARERLRKTLKISAPMRDDNSDGARTPLSPRIYVDPGAPPEPPSAVTVDSRHYYPNSPATMRSWRENDEYEQREDLDAVRALPREYPLQSGVSNTLSSPLEMPNRMQTASPSTRSASGDGTLPLRQYNSSRNIAQSSAGLTAARQPLHSSGLLSPPIQHHVLSVSQNRFYEAGELPWTPRTPVRTPHLTTRAERLQQKKEEKALRGAITEEDQVKDESEVWEDAY